MMLRARHLPVAALPLALLAASCGDDTARRVPPTLADGTPGVHVEAECAFGPTTGDCGGKFSGTQSGAMLGNGGTTVGFFDGGDYLAYRGVDVTDLDSLHVSFASANGGPLEVHLDGAGGRLVGRHDMAATSGWTDYEDARFAIQPTAGVHDVYLVGGGSSSGIGNFDWFELDVCRPRCDGKSCGDDGCGGTCGTCGDGFECNAQQTCVPCQPICAGKACGDDTCGGSCGGCADGEVCAADRTCKSYATLGGPPRLHADGRVLENAAGDEVVLRGVALVNLSTQFFQRPGALTGAIDRVTAPDWATKVLRFPVYTDLNPIPFPLGDRVARESYMSRVLRPAVDYATSKGVYVIVDFHQIANVTAQKDQDAQRFWSYMSGQFAGYPNVIYELFNEPVDNDNDCVAGRTDACWPPFKAKADNWISIVRQHAPDSLILVGGPSWSQVIGPAADDPVADANVAYVGHIYPRHIPGGAVAAQIARCAAAHPVILTEWGYNPTDDPSYVGVMQDLITSNRLSWTAWVADYDWTPAMFTTTYDLTGFGMTVKDWLSAPVP